MIPVKEFEESLTAALSNDIGKLDQVIAALIERAKQKNHNTEVAKLRSLSKKIKPQRSMYAQGASVSAGVVSGGKSLLYDFSNPDIELKNVILAEKEKTTVSKLIYEWDYANSFAEHGLSPQNRVIIYGKPGTGKTMLAKAISNTLQLPLIYVRLDELISSYLGKTGKNIREIFEIAESSRVVIFLDEIDTIAKQRDDSQELGELKRVVTVLLQNIDNFSKNSILIAATNHEQLLDPAIWRRFPVRLHIDLPARKERTELIKNYIGDWKSSIDIKMLVSMTDGMSGSDIEEVITSAKKLSIVENSNITNLHIVKSITQFVSGDMTNKKLRTKIYNFGNILMKQGYKIREISEATGLPYSTIRDNLTGIK